MKKIVMLLCSILPFFAYAQNQSNAVVYEEMVNDYFAGKLKDQQLLTLALLAVEKKQDSLGTSVAKVYKSKMLDKPEISKVITPDLKSFLEIYYSLFTIKSRLIRYMINHPALADQKFKEAGFSRRVTDFMVKNELIAPVIQQNGISTNQTPNWIDLERAIRNETDTQTAHRLLIDTKLSYYNEKQDWANVIKYQIEKMDTQGIDTVGLGRSMVNNMVYDVIFMHSEDTGVLNKGVQYMQELLKHNPKADTWIDTYANLLYKLGKKQEAIVQQNRALEIATERNDQSRKQEYQKVIDKMLSGQPTWK